MSDLWDEIQPSVDPELLRTRRVDPRHPLDFFYGKDFEGRFIFSCHGSFSIENLPKPPSLTGVNISFLQGPSANELRLVLLEETQRDIFRALCANLMSTTMKLQKGEDTSGIKLILNRLQRWQELLKARKEKLLSITEVIGLYGELIFLRDFFLSKLSPFEALAAWRGTSGDEQDFIFGKWLLEVKTQLATADRKLQISSMDQLDTLSGQVLLCYQTLAVAEKKILGAESLNSLISSISNQISNISQSAVDLFQSVLIDFGYMEREEYDFVSYILASRTYFEVGEGFPRIVPSIVPLGVEDVRYCIRVAICEPFAVMEDQALEWVFTK